MTTEERTYTDERGRCVLPPIDERDWKQMLWEISDSGVLSITLNRPERLNAQRNQGTEDASEGIASFHEKRTPVFKGR